MRYRIALVGNPNCGKTTLFNELTGSNQYVGNWPGVTVEQKTGHLKHHENDVDVVDLPGIYSLSIYSLEEVITRDYIEKEHPHCGEIPAVLSCHAAGSRCAGNAFGK